MPGARSLIKPKQPEKVFHKRYKRAGVATDTERKLIAQFVADQPREIQPSQVTALAKVMRRSKDMVQRLVEDAREEFVASAHFYVDSHKQAVGAALANGDAKSLDVAARSSQWAMENLSAEGQRIIDKAVKADTGSKIMVGIRIGGMNDPNQIVEAKVLPLSEDLSEAP